MKIIKIRKEADGRWRTACRYPHGKNASFWYFMAPSHSAAIVSTDAHIRIYHTPAGMQARELEALIA